ncbi:MAG: response regulator [Spirochaetota bacterium]
MEQIAETRKILVVDDSSTSRMITKRCFETAAGRELTFLEACDGAEALSILHSEPVDLIVTDINMPKMDGMTFVWKVKMSKRLEATPIIVLSSMKNERIESALTGLGVGTIIQKPISPAKIAEYTGAPA